MKNFQNKKLRAALTVILIYTQMIPSLAVADTILPANNNTTQAPTGMSSTTLQTAENTAQASTDSRNAAQAISQSIQAQAQNLPTEPTIPTTHISYSFTDSANTKYAIDSDPNYLDSHFGRVNVTVEKNGETRTLDLELYNSGSIIEKLRDSLGKKQSGTYFYEHENGFSMIAWAEKMDQMISGVSEARDKNPGLQAAEKENIQKIVNYLVSYKQFGTEGALIEKSVSGDKSVAVGEDYVTLKFSNSSEEFRYRANETGVVHDDFWVKAIKSALSSLETVAAEKHGSDFLRLLNKHIAEMQSEINSRVLVDVSADVKVLGGNTSISKVNNVIYVTVPDALGNPVHYIFDETRKELTRGYELFVFIDPDYNKQLSELRSVIRAFLAATKRSSKGVSSADRTQIRSILNVLKLSTNKKPAIIFNTTSGFSVVFGTLGYGYTRASGQAVNGRLVISITGVNDSNVITDPETVYAYDPKTELVKVTKNGVTAILSRSGSTHSLWVNAVETMAFSISFLRYSVGYSKDSADKNIFIVLFRQFDNTYLTRQLRRKPR